MEKTKVKSSFSRKEKIYPSNVSRNFPFCQSNTGNIVIKLVYKRLNDSNPEDEKMDFAPNHYKQIPAFSCMGHASSNDKESGGQDDRVKSNRGESISKGTNSVVVLQI